MWNEVCTEILLKIATKLGMNVKPKNAFCILLKFTDMSRKTLVCFSSVEVKHTFMDLIKKQKLMAELIDVNWNNTAIYVNSHMTSDFQNLFFGIRNSTKEVSFKFIWFKNNKINVKKKMKVQRQLLLKMKHLSQK